MVPNVYVMDGAPLETQTGKASLDLLVVIVLSFEIIYVIDGDESRALRSPAVAGVVMRVVFVLLRLSSVTRQDAMKLGMEMVVRHRAELVTLSKNCSETLH